MTTFVRFEYGRKQMLDRRC